MENLEAKLIENGFKRVKDWETLFYKASENDDKKLMFVGLMNISGNVRIYIQYGQTENPDLIFPKHVLHKYTTFTTEIDKVMDCYSMFNKLVE